MAKFNVIHLNAGNDTNGNPRRVYVILHNSDIVAAYDEGYAGINAITNPAHKKQAINSCMFSTTPKEYRSLIAGA